jgi:acyl-CoA synthetase (AMP-forming)/AMP-acid ligase II
MVSGYFHRSRFDARHGTVNELMVKGVKGVKPSRKERNKRTERNGKSDSKSGRNERNGRSRGSRGSWGDRTDTGGQGGQGDDGDTSSGSDGGGEGVDDNEDKEGDGDWVLVGGVRYFRTGDIGEMVGPGEVRVIDRCKSFFKLAQGMFVAPDPIESVLRESPLVDDIFVYGNGYMRAVAVVVVPAAALLAHFPPSATLQDCSSMGCSSTGGGGH